MADAPSISKPSITGDVEIEREQAPPSPPPYTSTSSLPHTVGGEPVSTGAGAGDVHLKLAGVAIEISEKQVPMVGLFISSGINLISASLDVSDSHRYYEYSITAGAVGMFLSAIGIALSWKPAWDRGSFGKWNSAICFLWSFIAGCILTFGKGPFVETGNGYFSSWGMVIFSIQTLGVTAKQMKESAYDGSSLLGLGLASLVLIIGLSTELVDDTTYKVNIIYSLLLAIVTLIFVERLRDFDSQFKSFAVTCFAVMWVVAACLLTFDGPFVTTGNGYFAAWAAAIMCVFAANDEFLEMAAGWVDRNFVSHVKHFAGHDEENPAGATSQGQNASSGVHERNLAPSVNTMSPYVEDMSTEDTFQLSIDLPGVTMDDVDVHLDGRLLVISGTRNADDTSSARTLTKSFEVDLDTLDTDKLTAKLQNGVLHVAAPRTKKEVKQITISSE